MSVCRSCRAEVVWATHHASARPMPFDTSLAAPFAHGAFIIVAGVAYSSEAAITAVVGRGGGVTRTEAVEGLHAFVWRTSHFATCPDADKHRRARGG